MYKTKKKKGVSKGTKEKKPRGKRGTRELTKKTGGGGGEDGIVKKTKKRKKTFKLHPSVQIAQKVLREMTKEILAVAEKGRCILWGGKNQTTKRQPKGAGALDAHETGRVEKKRGGKVRLSG